MKGRLYEYKGNHYEVIEGEAKMKEPEHHGGIWVKAVIYKDLGGDVFIRSHSDFKAKFNPIS